jgi:hypothetical protein
VLLAFTLTAPQKQFCYDNNSNNNQKKQQKIDEKKVEPKWFLIFVDRV